MAERVRRVQDVEPAAPTFGVGRAEQEVTQQRFPGGNLFVGEHIPRAGLQPAALDERFDVALALRPRAQIVLDEDSLTIEQEAAKR